MNSIQEKRPNRFQYQLVFENTGTGERTGKAKTKARRPSRHKWEERGSDRAGAIKLTLAFLVPAIALVMWAALFMG